MLCLRHLRRVVDLLRQLPVLPRGLMPERLKNMARDAADRMDRSDRQRGRGRTTTKGSMDGAGRQAVRQAAGPC